MTLPQSCLGTTLLPPLVRLNASPFKTPATLKRLAGSSRKLAEIKAIAASILNQGILINTSGLQQAKDRPEIANIVITPLRQDSCPFA